MTQILSNPRIQVADDPREDLSFPASCEEPFSDQLKEISQGNFQRCAALNINRVDELPPCNYLSGE